MWGKHIVDLCSDGCIEAERWPGKEKGRRPNWVAIKNRLADYLWDEYGRPIHPYRISR